MLLGYLFQKCYDCDPESFYVISRFSNVIGIHRMYSKFGTRRSLLKGVKKATRRVIIDTE